MSEQVNKLVGFVDKCESYLCVVDKRVSIVCSFKTVVARLLRQCGVARGTYDADREDIHRESSRQQLDSVC